MKTYPKDYHHEFSPSGLGTLKKSPCYIGKSEPGRAAIRGTACHKALETGDDKGLNKREIRLVEYARDYIKKIELGCLFTEREIRLHVIDGDDELTNGTADFIAVHKDEVHIVDFKTGRWPVAIAKMNVQMRAYAAGAFCRYPATKAVVTHIVQPAVEIPTSFHRFTLFEKEMLITEIYEAISYIKETRTKGTKIPSFACKFCAEIDECEPGQVHLKKAVKSAL